MILTLDAYGRVIISGLDGSQVLEKSSNGIDFVPVARYQAQVSWVDRRPMWNWRRVPYLAGEATNSIAITENCTAIAVAVNPRTYLDIDDQEQPIAAFGVALDGVPVPVGQMLDTYQGQGRLGDWGTLLWGKRFPARAEHTVTISYPDSVDEYEPHASDRLIGHVWSDFYCPIGGTVTYRYGAETATVELTVDRAGVVQDLIDKVVVIYDNLATPPAVPLTTADGTLNMLSALYAAQPDARLLPIAQTVYDIMQSQCGAVGSLTYNNFIPANSPEDTGGSVITTGRRLIALYHAYKTFGVDAYLTAACKIASYAHANWSRRNIEKDGESYVDVWDSLHDGSAPRGTGDIPGRNHLTKLVGGCALVCGEPAVQTVAGGAYANLYQSESFRTLIRNNMDAALGKGAASRINAAGELGYYGRDSDSDRGYAYFELGDLVLASRLNGNHRAAELTLLIDWMDNLALEEPFYFFSNQHPQPNWTAKRLLGRLLAQGGVDQGFVDACFYSGSYDNFGGAATDYPDDLAMVMGFDPVAVQDVATAAELGFYPVLSEWSAVSEGSWAALGLDAGQWSPNAPAEPSSPLFFTTQPVALSLAEDGGVVGYGTADGGAEDAVSEATVSAMVLDTQVFSEAVSAIGTAGVSAQDATMMLEGVFAAAQAAATVTDTAQRVEGVLAAIAAGASVADAVQLVEAVISSAEAQVSVVDQVLSGVAENLVSVAAAADSASDVQLMVDNVTVMAQGGAALDEIASYLEQVVSTATAQASVSEALYNELVERYLHTCVVSDRCFYRLCRARGAVLMLEMEKPAYNEEWQTLQFLRPDGRGQLAEGELVTSCDVICTERQNGTDRTAEMIGNVAPYASTHVKFWLKGGVAGNAYLLAVRCVTSSGRKLCEYVNLRVV